MISAKKAKRITNKNNDFFKKYEISKLIKQSALSGYSSCDIYLHEPIPLYAKNKLKELGYSIYFISSTSVLHIEW